MTAARKRNGARRNDDVLEMLALIWELDHELRRMSKHMEAKLGVTGPQRLAVRVLGREPNMTAGDLARTLRLHPSTLTGILRRLEDNGLVKRVQDANDKRRSRFTLTTKGRGYDVEAPGTLEAAVREMLRNPRVDVARGRALLSELVAALQRSRVRPVRARS